MILLQQYEGTDSKKKRIIIANQYISLHQQKGLFYNNKHIFLFDKYNAGLQAEFLAITKYKNQAVQENMVQRLIDGIQFQNNLTITLANMKIKDDKLGNWIGAMYCMENKVADAFGVAKENKNQWCGGNRIRISEIEGCRQGRGGRG